MRASGLLALMSLSMATIGCATVRQGDVGVKRTFGVISETPLDPGIRVINPVATRVIRVPVRTVNLEVALDLPSQEGLNVRAEISILYRVRPEDAPTVIAEIGPDYEQSVIVSVFRSASADVTANYMAKDMHSGSRAEIEEEIRGLMEQYVQDRGFEIEAVLLKSITLPPGLYAAVEQKLAAEQDAQRMEFLLQRERLEAERKRVAATGERDAQLTLAQALTPEVIEWNRIQAFRDLSTSPNTKIVVAPQASELMMPIDVSE